MSARVAMTGSRGFLGWHTRAALRERCIDAAELRIGDEFELDAAAAAIAGRRFVHIAGVNRASDEEIRDGNLLFATQAAAAIRKAEHPPDAVVFANSIHASGDSVYGEAKRRAAELLETAAHDVGSTFVDLQLPNLFGEHGRPFYNAVTATFCHLLANGRPPTVQDDKQLELLHAQDAADLLIGETAPTDLRSLTTVESVGGLLDRLASMAETYRSGDIPNVSLPFDRDLFNTYRSYTSPRDPPMALHGSTDQRGGFFEIVRSHGGPGQSSFSTTEPGVVRGNHFHRRKIERFAVVSGRAVIRLRKLFSDEVVEVEVEGTHPVAIDMPTLWAHSIENVGDGPLYTAFWSNEIYDAGSPDTIPEAVLR